MRIHISAFLILFAFLLCMGFPQTEERNAASFSVSVDLVEVPISVFDEDGKMITDLRSEDFRVREDNALQQIRNFGRNVNTVSVVMLIDTSQSTKKEKNKIRDAAREFTKALSPGDRVSVITFDEHVRLFLDWTDDMKRARKKLGSLKSGLQTALYDAMYLAANEQLKDIEGRKAVILLTDCLDNFSRISFPEAALEIIQSQASLYVVSKTAWMRKEVRKDRRVKILEAYYRVLFEEDYIDDYFNTREAEMEGLADKTGGRCFFPQDYDQVKRDYAAIAREMKNTYYLTYISNQKLLPDSSHEISIEYLKPHSKMNYRKGYYYLPQKTARSRIQRPSFK